MKSKQDILNAFRERFDELVVKKSGDEYYAMILPKDIHEDDEYGLPDIEKFLLNTLTEFERDLIKDIKKKLPKLQGFDDYDKHVHTYATENRGNCGICGLSWKRTTETGYYNQAIFDVRKVLSQLEKEKRT